MLIAYDLRYAADHFTGIGTHAHALFAALLELPGDDRYAVLWDPRLASRRYDLRAFASHPRVAWHERTIAPLGPASPLQLGAWLRAVRPDVYLSPFYFAPVGAPCPVLLTIHDVWPLRLPEGFSWARGAIYRLSLQLARRARFIVTSSRFSRDEIVELLPMPESRVRAIRLGVPPAPRDDGARRPDALVAERFALVVGDNRPRKNLGTIARAWGGFGDAPPLALVSAGPNDPRYPSLAALAAESGARDVHSLGWVGEPELAWLYRNAEMILFPSRYEGFGFPLVEAFVHGRPTIAADIPVLREIAEGVSWFVPVDADREWADAVRSLAVDAGLRERTSRAGHVRAAELRYRDTAAETLDLVREAAGATIRGR